jgi:hypothetical protein
MDKLLQERFEVRLKEERNEWQEQAGINIILN